MTSPHDEDSNARGTTGSTAVGDVASATDSSRHIHTQPLGEPGGLDGDVVYEERYGTDATHDTAGPACEVVCKQLNSGPKRNVVDEMMMNECRHWIASVVGEAYNTEVLERENFVDALRSGVVLLVLLQKLSDPPVPDSELRVPKRADGFFARDNVMRFLRQAAKMFSLAETELFTDSDLCDGKNDRAVVTCLLSIARTAYRRGDVEIAPATIVRQQELSVKVKQAAFNRHRECLQAGAENTNSEETEKVGAVAQTESCHIPLDSAPGCDECIEKSDKRVEVESATHKFPDDAEDKPLSEETEQEGLDDTPQFQEHGTIEKVVSRGGGNQSSTEVEDSHVTPVGRAPVRVKIEGRPSEGVKPSQYRILRVAKEPRDGGVSLAPQPEQQHVASPQSKGAEGQTRVPTAPPSYRPRRWDKIDILLSAAVNAHFMQHPDSGIRFHRLSGNTGEYVVVHKATGRKELLQARMELGRVVVGVQRKGGNLEDCAWTNLAHWLEQRERRPTP